MDHGLTRTADDSAPAALEALLRLLALCIEDPAAAAAQTAAWLSAAGLAIILAARLMGMDTGAALALLYVASAWTLALCLRGRPGEARHAG